MIEYRIWPHGAGSREWPIEGWPIETLHVWSLSLDRSPLEIAHYRSLLTPEEIARADRFRFHSDRDRFVTTRGVLRQLLGHYLRRDPRQIELVYGTYGKPEVAPAQQGSPPLFFNVSHCRDWALYGVACDRAIGIDIEWVDPGFPYSDMVPQLLSPGEQQRLQQLNEELRPAAFFTCWTRKEAYLKAKGCGLSYPLNQLEVAFLPDEPAAILSTAWDPQESRQWQLYPLTISPNHAASLAVQV